MGKSTFNGTSDAVVYSLDFMPTFAELSGATLPDRVLDGQSIISLIETGNQENKTFDLGILQSAKRTPGCDAHRRMENYVSPEKGQRKSRNDQQFIQEK